ncbi:peptidylprolyl isomerase [Nannocystis sp. SCPEA4]|uniref:peptidylprolyl isomerase n=1 Tax=Nannocystis sp. SCPEA4 TaxID=2996787 RepID=UPI002272084D|nr:peptidylprolyl isomerase [Nannocystis sp. SCPEA4]MCY1061792.1 peptidylprolyl isomerase [Nannocystis sp. SCPEA4]
MEVPRRVPIIVGGCALLLACARPPASPPAGGEDEALAVARAEARREAGSAELVTYSRGGTSAASLAAIRGLGRTGDARSLARLGELLAAPEEALRVAAMEALALAGALGSEVSAYEATLWQGWPQASSRERLAIVKATWRVGAATAVARLAAALAASETAEVRAAAAIGLGLLGRRELALDEAARDELVAMVASGEQHLVYAAVYGLAHAHQAGHDAGEAALQEAVTAIDPDARALALKGLARRRGAGALAAMRAGLDDPEPWVRVAAVRGLGELGDAAATATLWDWLRVELERDIVDGTGSGHPVLEAMSILTAGKTGPPGAAEALARAEARVAAAKPASQRVQARMACGLAALAGRTAEWRPPLRCAEALGPAAEIERLTFETGLIGQGYGGSAEARAARLATLVGHADARVRAAALAAAAKLWEVAPIEGLIEAGLRDSSPAVAGTAAEAVQGRFAGDAPRPAPGPGLVDALVQRAAGERDGELFAGLAGALAEVGGARGLQVCRDALGDANATVRAAARACVKTGGGDDPGVTGPSAPPPLPPHEPRPVQGQLLWLLHTERGRVDIALEPAAAPWHVAAIVALTRAGFYDGLGFHRVVPGYVVQGGDPGGTGWGGPGFTLPSEPGEAPFASGAVGIADAGKDTGGSQFFIMHAPAPHLDGRYTRIGEVRDGLPAALALVVGDRIHKAEIVIAPQRPGL